MEVNPYQSPLAPVNVPESVINRRDLTSAAWEFLPHGIFLAISVFLAGWFVPGFRLLIERCWDEFSSFTQLEILICGLVSRFWYLAPLFGGAYFGFLLGIQRLNLRYRGVTAVWRGIFWIVGVGFWVTLFYALSWGIMPSAM
jgi:hypothetical protein